MTATGTDPVWRPDGTMTVDGVSYAVMDTPPPLRSEDLMLFKPRIVVECYEPIVAEFRGATIVELGIFAGGSTAYFAQRCSPRRLVAVDCKPDRVAVLDDFVRDHGFDDVVRCHYGIDQADTDALGAVLDEDLGGDLVDLVIDDASHRYEPTVRSFELLFPRLRPGGLYLVEDWAADDWLLTQLVKAVSDGDALMLTIMEARVEQELLDDDSLCGPTFRRAVRRSVDDPSSRLHEVLRGWYDDLGRPGAPEARTRIRAALDAGDPRSEPALPSLGTLGLQLLLAIKSLHPAVSDLVATPWWIAIRRGFGPLGPDFRFDELGRDPFGLLGTVPAVH